MLFMMVKWFAGVGSALLLSYIATYANYSPEAAARDSYYAFSRQFAVGALILLAVYLLFLVPISAFLDRLAGYYFKRRYARILVSFLSYAAVPACFAFVALLLFTGYSKAFYFSAIVSVLGAVFWLVQAISAFAPGTAKRIWGQPSRFTK